MQLVCLGTGNKDLFYRMKQHTHIHTQNGMRWLESTYKDKARCWVGFNVPFSHRYARGGSPAAVLSSRLVMCATIYMVYVTMLGVI